MKKEKKLILVDKNDKIIGFEKSEKCHQKPGLLHRAFTIFIFNKKNQLLIQKRSKQKKLWPLFWEASCSSHPQKGESYLKAAKKRLKEELGFSCPLKFLGKFQYQAVYRNSEIEKEICALLVGRYQGKIQPNFQEIENYKWVNFQKLAKEIKKRRNKKYTPWLKLALKNYQNF